MKSIVRFCFLLLASVSFSTVSLCQSDVDTLAKTVRIAAGPEYKRSGLYRFFWGSNYRKEWTEPITFPIIYLDTLKGGIKEFKRGGGHQSKSLHIKTAEGKTYALRSISKSLDKLIPIFLYHTFIRSLANDKISMSNPYGALGVPVMAAAAGIPHATPQYLYVPKQPALDSLNDEYGDKLYLFEQSPSGDWSNEPNFLNFKDFIDSEDLMKKLFNDNEKQVDQVSFVRARLFDMVIGDWDRHLDQWKWGETDFGKLKVYKPIPIDRDQAFSTHDGLVLNIAMAAAGIKYMQKFDYTIKNVTATERRFLDRWFTNMVTKEQWEGQAKSLQHALTDAVIEASIKQMPPEIFAIRGNELIAKLKSRRDHLVDYAVKYYYYLADEAEIVGSKKSEYFEINRLNDDQTQVRVFDLNKQGKPKEVPFYSRIFNRSETSDIKIYGLSGEDIYTVSGNVRQSIRISIIGGDGKDSIADHSNGKLVVYDDANNVFEKGPNTKLIISESTDHTFNYNTFPHKDH